MLVRPYLKEHDLRKIKLDPRSSHGRVSLMLQKASKLRYNKKTLVHIGTSLYIIYPEFLIDGILNSYTMVCSARMMAYTSD